MAFAVPADDALDRPEVLDRHHGGLADACPVVDPYLDAALGNVAHLDLMVELAEAHAGAAAHFEARRALDMAAPRRRPGEQLAERSEEHTSELQSLMRTSYAVFCLKKKQ